MTRPWHPPRYKPPKTPEAQVADRWWRLCNLYSVVDEKGNACKFVPRPQQADFYWRMWYQNLVLKSRQHGFCLDPNTRVLRADLRWCAIADLRVGDQVVAVDEDPPGGKGRARRMRTADVQGVVVVHREAYRITFDDGRSVVCTGKHPWLSRKSMPQAEWRTIEAASQKKLRVGTQVRWVTKPWGEAGVEDGWFAGLLDGEGCFQTNRSATLAVSQVDGVVLNRARDYLSQRGYRFSEEIDTRKGRHSKLGSKPVHRLTLGRSDEIFRVLGQCRPTRFIHRRWWEGRELPGKRNGDVGWATIESIEPLGERAMIDLQTSTGTYIAEGFVSHNTTFLAILAIDLCAWRPNYHAHLLAHTLHDSERLFTDKIRWVISTLLEEHPHLAPVYGTSQESAKQLQFPNGSTISCGTSMRGGTVQFLHISEHGKICAKFPDKAKEIRSGALNTVHAGQIIVIESTAEGRQGDFFEYAETARKRGEAKSPLTPLDFRFFFYPWWKDKKNVLDPRHVVISNELKTYFADIKTREGIRLTPGQKAWYAKKYETQRDLMYREHPSTPQEAFQGAVEGTYYGKVMLQLRRQGRIVPSLPFDLSIPVDTTWDLGKNDNMAVWWHQWVRRLGEHWWLRFEEGSSEGLAYWVQLMNEVQREYGFTYGRHYLPHDVEVSEQSMAKGETRRDFMEGLGVRNIVVVQRVPSILDGIEAVRTKILPISRFSEEGCGEGIVHLENYRREFDERLESFKETPAKTPAIHGADALRQIAQEWHPDVAYQGLRGSGRKRSWRQA